MDRTRRVVLPFPNQKDRRETVYRTSWKEKPPLLPLTPPVLGKISPVAAVTIWFETRDMELSQERGKKRKRKDLIKEEEQHNEDVEMRDAEKEDPRIRKHEEWVASIKEGDRIDARLENGFYFKARVQRRIGDAIYVLFENQEVETDRWIFLKDGKHSSKVAPVGTRSKNRKPSLIIERTLSATKIDAFIDGVWMPADILLVDDRQVQVRLSARDGCTVWFHLNDPTETAALYSKSSISINHRFVRYLLDGQLLLAKAFFENHKKEIDLSYCEPKPEYQLKARSDWALTQQHTPLNAAVLSKNLRLVNWLVKLGADINSRTALYTPLMLAAYNDDVRMANFLIAKGADLYAQCRSHEYHMGFVELIAQLHSPRVHQVILDAHVDQFRAEVLAGAFHDGEPAEDLNKRLRFARQFAFLMELYDIVREKQAGYSPLAEALAKRACFEGLFQFLCRKATGQAIPGDPAEVVRSRINRYPDILNERLEGNGETMLMRMICGGSLEMTKILVEAGADVNMRDHRGLPTIFYACTGGYALLNYLEPLCPPNVFAEQSFQGVEALCYAIEASRGARSPTVQHLLAKRAKGIEWGKMFRPDGSSLLWQFARTGDKELIEMLLDEAGYTGDPAPDRPVLPSTPSPPLHWAIVRKTNRIVAKMAKVCNTINARAEITELPALMHCCAREGNIPAAFILLDHGADPLIRMPDNSKPMDQALINARSPTVKRILRSLRESFADREGVTELMKAAYDNDLRRCTELLESLASDREREDEVLRPSAEHCFTSLHWAAATDAKDVFPLLLSHGKSLKGTQLDGPNAIGCAGFTPFLLACLCGSFNVVEQILQYVRQEDQRKVSTIAQPVIPGAFDFSGILKKVEANEKKKEKKEEVKRKETRKGKGKGSKDKKKQQQNHIDKKNNKPTDLRLDDDVGRVERVLKQHTLSRMGALTLACYSHSPETVEALLKNSPEESKLRELLVAATPLRFVELSMPDEMMPFDIDGTLKAAERHYKTWKAGEELEEESKEKKKQLKKESEQISARMRALVDRYLPCVKEREEKELMMAKLRDAMENESGRKKKRHTKRRGK